MWEYTIFQIRLQPLLRLLPEFSRYLVPTLLQVSSNHIYPKLFCSEAPVYSKKKGVIFIFCKIFTILCYTSFWFWTYFSWNCHPLFPDNRISLTRTTLAFCSGKSVVYTRDGIWNREFILGPLLIFKSNINFFLHCIVYDI